MLFRSSISNKIGAIKNFTGDLFGFGDNEEKPQLQPQVAGPQQRVSKSIQENNNNSNATVTIKDESGRASVSDGKLGNSIRLQNSGAF